MATTLPRLAGLKLEQALGQWQHWHSEPALPGAPHMERVLTAGHSNHSVLVSAAGQRFVVRIDGITPAANGINRQLEWRALQAAYAAGIAPRPCYFNPDLGVLVTSYLPADANQPHEPVQMAQLLQRIHALPARRHRLDLAERLQRYEHQLAKQPAPHAAELSRYRPGVQRALQRCTADQQPLVLCHNDLLRANRLYSGGQLFALDWEYCAMASPWYELAVITCGDELSPEDAGKLLERYLERPAAEQEYDLLADYSSVYRYLELAWYLAQQPDQLTEEAINRRLSALHQSLQDPG